MADDGGEPDEFLYKVLVVGEVNTLPKPADFRLVERWKLRPPRRRPRAGVFARGVGARRVPPRFAHKPAPSPAALAASWAACSRSRDQSSGPPVLEMR